MNEYLCVRNLWGYDMSEDSCAIRVTLSGSGTVSAQCYMSGSKTPQCATVFGSNENIPSENEFEGFPGTKAPAVYNCDPNGDTGQIPATINTIHAEECRCPAREALNDDNVCEPEQCAAGMTIFVDPPIDYSGCNDENEVAIAEDGRAKGWGCHITITETSKVLHCDIYINDYSAGEDGPEERSACTITSPAAQNFCGKFFGWPPQFPTATGNEEEDQKAYVANCDKGGKVPGAIPATINTIGAKACGCDSAGGFVGDWPNCACPAGEEILADGTCGGLHEVVYSFFPATLIAFVNTHSFAITPEGDSSTRLGLPLTGGALRATLEAGQTIRLHVSTNYLSISLSNNRFCGGVGEGHERLREFSDHRAVRNEYSTCAVTVTSPINIELYLSPTVAGTPPPPRRVRVAGLAGPADGTGGTVATAGEVSAGGWADAGALVTFTATPAEGWYVGDWEGEGGRCQDVGDRGKTGAAAGALTCALAADDDLLVTANFARPGAVFTVVFSYAPATLTLAPRDLAILSSGGEILATLSDGRAVAEDIEANSPIRLFLQNAPAGYGVESVSLDECRAHFTGFHGGLPEPERGPERSPSNGDDPCSVQVNHNLDVMVTFAPLADCEERNLPLKAAAADSPRMYNRLLCGECPGLDASPPTHRRVGDYCVPLSGNFGTLSDKALCGIFGGNMDEGAEVCSGMDANDTFCILDAEEADSALAFPCRGLFKHLRSCNLEFNRKALNPFFCGGKCGASEEAFGSGCR